MATSTHTPVHSHSHPEDASLGELAGRLSEQVSRLVRDELALVQLEAKQKAKRMGVGVGMISTGGLFALLGTVCGVAAAVLGLSLVVSAWLAALLVGAALFALAGVFALTGLLGIRRAAPPVPKEALDSARTDLAVVREAVHR
jgi:hypothetical protein